MANNSELATEETVGRVRRPTDLSLSLLALAALASTLAVAHALPIGVHELTADVSSWLSEHVPRVVALTLGVVVDLGSATLAVVAIVTALRSDARDAWNALAAGFLGSGFATVAVVVWRAHPGRVSDAMLHGSDATIFVSTLGFTAYLTGTDLIRRQRWTRWCLGSILALLVVELALNDLTFLAVLVAPLGGWGVGLLVRWLFGAASVRPSASVLAGWLRSEQIPIATLRPAGRSRVFVGTLDDGTATVIRFANRDTRGSGAIRGIWRLIRLRGSSAGPAALSSRSRLDQQALAAYRAHDIGVVAPTVLTLGEMPPETLVLALAVPTGASLDGETSDAGLVALFAALRDLHHAGVAHRDLRPTNLVVGGSVAGFASLERAESGAGDLLRRLDVAQLATSIAQVANAERAVKALREGYLPETDGPIAAVLQPVALAAWGWSSMRAARAPLAAVRTEFIGASESGPPIRLERFSYRTVFSAVALTIAAFLLIGQLSKVNLLGALSSVIPGWYLLAIVASAATYFGAALNLAAFVPKHLSMVRGFFVQLSTAFVGVAMPPTVGHVAVNSRYLHRQGVDEGSIAAAVAVSQIVNVVTTVALLIAIGLLTGSGVSHFKLAPSADLLIGVGAIVAVIGVLAAIPRTRRLFGTWVWPHVRAVIPRLLDAVSEPLRLAVGIAGNLVLTVGYIVALDASLLALGAHAPVLATAAVYLAGNTVGSLAPTPGGIGAVEAVLSAGLTAIGIPAHEAVPAVLIFRTATFWLPIPTGAVAYHFLLRSGTL